MRLLVVTPWWPADEADAHGSFVRDQVLALQGAGHDVRVEVIRTWRPGTRAPRRAAPPAARVHLLAWRPYARAYDSLVRAWASRLRAALGRQGRWLAGAVVVAHTQEFAVPAHIALGGRGIPWVVVAHGLEPDSPRYATATRRRRYACALRSASRVVAVGPTLAAALALEAPGADVVWVGNGWDEATVAAAASGRSARAGEAPRLVAVGNLVEGKGVDLLLEALARRAASGRTVPALDLVGDGPQRRALEAQARALGPGVRFHGHLPHPDALRVVAGADAFVLPSAPEAFGIAYLEAMALGVPVVGVRGEGPQAFVRDGVDGFLVERTAEGVGRAVDDLLEDPARAAALGAAARARAQEFTWARAAARFAEVMPAPKPLPRRVPRWLALYEEPTPYVVGKLDRAEATGLLRWRRAFAARNASQAWGEDAPLAPGDAVGTRGARAALLGEVLRRRVAGVHAGGWGGSRLTPAVLLCAWAARLPLSLESDTHAQGALGLKAALRRAYLGLLDRRMLAWWPGGTPQAEHLRASARLRAPVRIERMTTDTEALTRRAEEAGPDAGARWRARHGVPPRAPLLLYVGRLVPEKGIGELLEAVARLAARAEPPWLALLGPGDLTPFLPAGFPRSRVLAPGRVPWKDLVPAYLAADLLVLPSRWEPWGLVVNEALALGCPVVTTSAVGAARDLVERPRAGRVVAPGDVEALARALAQVLDAGGRRSPEAQRGLEVMAGWTLERAATTLARVLGGVEAPREAARC